MKAKKIKKVMALLLCIAFLVRNHEASAAITLFSEEAEWDKEAAVYWNPGESRAYYGGESGLATRSDATSSNAAKKFRQGSDRANGLSPRTAVKSFSTALGRAEKLSRQMDIDITDVVIYAMNPLFIPSGKSCAVSGKEVTVMPWEGRREAETPIFIVEGGTLSLDNITLQSESDGSPEESVLVYLSSGTVQLGEQAEVYGTIALDYTRLENGQSTAGAADAERYAASASNTGFRAASASDAGSLPEDIPGEPVIELTNWFDMVEGNYTLDLRIPEDRDRDVVAVRTLHASQMFVDDFLAAFTVKGTAEDWEILAEGRNNGIFHDTTSAIQASPSNTGASDAEQVRKKDITSDKQETILTQKSLIARRIPGTIPNSRISGRLWLDRNNNGVMEESEQGIPDYSVSLFAADDRSRAVQTVKTQADGAYRFSDLNPGGYVVTIGSEMVGAKQYLLPEAGIANDNKFAITQMAGEFMTACSETIILTAESPESASINAGLYPGPGRSTFNIEYIYLPLGGNTLNSGDENRLVVMAADGDPAAGYYKAYAATAAGLSEALYDLYKEDTPEANYIIYLGGNISLTSSQSGTLFADTASATGAANVSFASLRGRLNTLVLTGHADDPVTETPAAAAPTACSLLSLSGSGERYFGSNIILRNIRHKFGAGTSSSYGVYMNGYDLTLGGDSWQTEDTRYFGGSSSKTVVPFDGTASITVYSTGTGASHFIGGMRTGVLEGNAEITINNTSGNAISLWGGGLGASASLPAYITGSVTNTITGMSDRSGNNSSNGLTLFVGGLDYGAVSGQITNTISGRGRFTSGTTRFIGGSRYGDVGTDATLRKAEAITDLSGLDTEDYIIRSNVDFSAYTYGTTEYNGTNYESGIVKGNVINIVKAGSSSGGGIAYYSGGAGSRADIGGTWSNTFTVNKSAAKVTNIDEGLAAAKNRSAYQLYGNITNELRGGCADPSTNYWFRGAGWGYMEGNVYSELGTESLLYKSGYDSYEYSTAINTQGNRTDLDLVGGGGDLSANNSFCIKGNTTLVMREVVARWTYGGSFGGVQIGDSKISLHGGVVDTCEGTGYRSYIHVGDGRAEVHGGQVDWFLSGGGWGDDYQDGSVSVEVFDQPHIIINASLGGTYGASSSHMISGNSTVMVHGGNFSGVARTGVKRGFSAGPSNSGYILGNADVTVDLRGNQYGFSLEARDSISGGRRIAAGNSTGSCYLGTDENNTIMLNILTDESQTDLLNGLDIYGDCASSSSSIDNTRAGKITINVNAPAANIGNLYATDYSNVSRGILRRDVEINLVSADTIIGLRSGNGDEDITNSVAQASEAAGRRAVLNIGPRAADPDHILSERETGETADGLPRRINISTDGIIGFTAMNIQKRLLVAQNGNIKNGANATVSNHGTTYHNFGALTLQAGQGMDASGLGISSAGAVFIAGAATVEGEGEVYIQSTGQVNQMILTDLVIPESGSVIWLKVGTVLPDTTLQTNWFGVRNGWRVITLSPDKTKAYERITPNNFRGIDEAAGMSFIGDSDTHFSGNYGYAVAILGSAYTWEVVEGNGMVSHNVPVSAAAPAPGETIKAYGTVPADTPSVQGRLAVPSSLIPDPVAYPEFKFIPDSGYDECVNYVDICGSDRYLSPAPHNYQIGRGQMYETKTWTASGDDKDYSFDITASFSEGDIAVYARNVIITEGEAAAISSADDVIAYTQAGGTPLFRHSITAELLAAIGAPLAADQTQRRHPVSYQAVNNDETGKSVTVNVIVVKDGTAVSSDRQYAVYANDAGMALEEARALSGQTALDSGYTHAVVILADGTNAAPVIDGSAIAAITGTTAGDCPKAVPVTYTYAPDDLSVPVSKTVTVYIVNQSKLIVSKQVAGDYIDKTREFPFTIYFRDSDGIALPEGTRCRYTGGILAGSGAAAPADGILTLDNEGKAMFKLKHGQQMAIETAQMNVQVRIVEADDLHYKASFTDSGGAGVTDGRDTGIVRLETADRAFAFLNTRIRTAVYIDGINGSDDNAGYVPTEPVRGLARAYEQLEAAGASVLYVVGTVPVNENTVITAAGYATDTVQVDLSAAAGHLDIRRFATPLAGDPNAGSLYSEKYDREDFLGTLFQIENGADFTIGAGIYFDGHYYPKNGAEYTGEFLVNRYLEVLSPLIQVEKEGALILLEGAQLKDNFNTREPAADEARVEGGAVYNSGNVKLSGAEILNNSSAKGAGIYQNGTFEITLNPYGIEGQEIYLTAVNPGGQTAPVWEDHIVTTAVWLPEDLKLNINMDHAAAGRPVVRYTNHTEADPQWENYILGETVPEWLFLVENEGDSSLLELQGWKIMDISIPNEIHLAVQQGKYGDISIKRADSNGFMLDSPAYKIKNAGIYGAKIFLTGFVNQNASVGIDEFERMNLVASSSNAVSDPAGKTDLYLAIAGTDDGGGGFGSLPETSLYDFDTEGAKQLEMGSLGKGEEAGFIFTGAASGRFMAYYMDHLFPFFSAAAADRIAHLRRKDPDTGEISANHARAMFKMSYRVELIHP